MGLFPLNTQVWYIFRNLMSKVHLFKINNDTAPKINQAVEWGANNGLTFSVDKTTAVFFSRQKKFHSEVLPRIKKNLP